MDLLSYDQFFYYTWENISEAVVDDNFYNNNQEFLNELTFLFYGLYTKTAYEDEDGFVSSQFSTGRVSNIIEGTVSLIKKIGIYE